MKRRNSAAILSVLLVAVMLLSLVPLTVSAATTATKISSLSEIGSGNYIISVVHDGTNYALTGVVGDKGTPTAFTPNNGAVADATGLFATFTAVSGETNVYTIKIGSTDLGASSSTDLTTDSDEWTVSTSDEGFRLTRANSPGRALAYQGGTENTFGNYKASTNNLNNGNYAFDLILYKVNGSGSGSETPPPVVTPTYVSISQARAAASGTEVYTEGTIIFIDGRNAVIYDGTAGINLYFGNAGHTLALGDKVKVKGTRGAYSGLEQLSSVEVVEPVSQNNTITYNASTIAAILADTTGAIESTPVKLENVVIGEINTSGNTAITDANGNTINIYKIPELTGIQEGDTVTVSVIVSDFNGYQLRVVSASDVEFVSKGNQNQGGGSVQTGDETLVFAGIAVLATMTLAGAYFAKKRNLAK